MPTKAQTKKKQKGGRPQKYTDLELFKKKVDEYFTFCDEKHVLYTMSDLACYLDMDRKTLLNYSKKDKFFPTIKKAKQYIEGQNERLLLSGKNVAGVIFNLKNNFGWEDTQTIDNNVNQTINIKVKVV